MRGTIRLLAASAAMFLIIGPVAAETRALLVGVWKFNSPMLKDLAGPENDLAAMEILARAEGATDVTVLRNDQVTRTAMETAMPTRSGCARSRATGSSSIIPVTSAEADAAVKGTRDGDRDQFLPLAKFDPADPERYIVDKDLYNWMSRYVPATVQVLMIADACHSGALRPLRRSPSAMRFTPRPWASAPRRPTSRSAHSPAPRFPAVLGGATPVIDSVERADLPNRVYLAAAKDEQLAWELPMPTEGAPPARLLTYNFEQGLTTRGRTASRSPPISTATAASRWANWRNMSPPRSAPSPASGRSRRHGSRRARPG
ncbi:caspase family protein [Sphingomonas sp. MMS24-JH45]